MKLISTLYDKKVWEDADIADILQREMDTRCDGGAIERLEGRITYLSAVVTRLVEHCARDDKHALQLLEVWHWEVTP